MDGGLIGVGQGRLERTLVNFGRQFIGGGNGVGDQQAGSEAKGQVRAQRRSQFLDRVHPAVHG
jgi:hypothetical protein